MSADDYQLLEELGSGSFGVVYKAIERATGELVAIKHVDLEASPDDLSDIQKEISILSACHSPYVTQYKASFVKGVKLWIVMEYLGGGSCLDLLRPGPISESHIAIICRELLLGLDYLHDTGKIHRDIKAANTLLSRNGQVKVADFGVSAQLNNIKSLRMTYVGTPFWMAPEVIQELGHDFSADLWSLGITAMELANGAPPHAEIHPMKVLMFIPKAPAPRLEGNKWSKDFKDFIAHCLIKDPDRRATAKELLRHRFITKAGKVEALRELILRKERWDAHEQMQDSHPRYYEETMHDLSPKDEQDEWVFDTIKPTTIAPPITREPLKRRKLARIPSSGDEDAEAMIERLNLNDTPLGTMSATPNIKKTRKVSNTSRRTSVNTAIRTPSGQTPTARRVSDMRRVSGQKKPLGVDMTYGNSPSTIRQFRRVSGEADLPTPLKHKRSQSAIHISNSSLVYEDSNVQDENTPLNVANPPIKPVTKEALLGRRAFTKIIDPAFQETYAQTGHPSKRDAIGTLANAWSALDRIDPEGEFLLLKMMLERVSGDAKLTAALGIQFTPQSPVKNTPAPAPAVRDITAPSTPSARPRESLSQQDSPTKQKLVLAQNNPHLKSHHRRRQSAFVGGAVDREVSEKYGGVDERKLPGFVQPGMETQGHISDMLYGRWLDALRVKWPLA